MGAFVKYEADLRKAPALSVDQTVQPDGSGINQLLNEVQAQPHQGVPHALMPKEQFAKFPLEFGRGIIQHCREKFFLRRKIAPQSTLRTSARSRDLSHGGGRITFFEKGSARDFPIAGLPLRLTSIF